MHQFKINGKMAFEGDVWQWHQDYGTWFNDDLMPTSRAMNVAIFLDDVTEFNGPLLFIPGSHKKGVKNYIINVIKNHHKDDEKVAEVIALVKENGGLDYRLAETIYCLEQIADLTKYFL